MATYSVTLTGSWGPATGAMGDSDCYVEIGSVQYKSAQVIEVQSGTVIKVCSKSPSTGYVAKIYMDDSVVSQSTDDNLYAEYELSVDSPCTINSKSNGVPSTYTLYNIYIVKEAPSKNHKTLIGGTGYEISGGRTLVDGTGYSIQKGRTLINGTGYDITFGPVMPVKGDLITMNLDGTSRLYRVLSVNGNVCKVLGMWDDFTSKYNEKSTTTKFNGITAQKYEGSILDTYLNTTWYNTLSSEAKNAIVPENVVQYCYKYYDEPNTPNTPTYTYQYQYNWDNSDYENADNVGNVTVGERNVFALDLKDIFDYFEKVCITSDELMTMFFNSTTTVNKYPWLRSSTVSPSDYVWRVAGNTGLLGRTKVVGSRIVRPALNLDMSKIQYTLV